VSSAFFTTEPYLTARFAALGRQFGFNAADLEKWRLWRAQLVSKLKELLGYERLVPAPLNPRVTQIVQCDGYRREHVLIDTEPGVTMALYALIPNGLQDSVPAILAPHGHDSGGKLCPAGVVEVTGVAERVKQYNYDYGRQAARRGYVVFCPDARGFGERRESLCQTPEALFESSCRQIAHMALPLGLTVAGMWTWDLSRLIDYALTRPECAGQPVGCIGLSGGGLQTLYVSALDERIQCAVISGYFYGVRDSLLHLSGNCDCNYVPHLWDYVDMGDIAALIAPRPALVETGTRDPLNGPRGIANVLEQFDIAKQAYQLLGVEERIAIDIFEGEHRWHGIAAFDWLDRWLKADGR